MNRQRLTQLRISPLHIQQALFASLALMVTLIAIQLFQHWENSRESAQIKQPFTYSQTYNSQTYSNASASMARDTALSLTPVDRKAPASEAPHQQTWVF
ncbi:hypothetical protein K3169_00490 [Pseudomonas phytophila]|uniref:Uncharacterized protein n=1 Tax=Pseudomonas phytophila TaxID=2867264 RepID=A0ABY6FEU8_9PSED|nr:hypothetical protein [Pseudomonas phytophila]UXZ96433.1 hypothetical protein K3169_00490 [Pseudomonas phytophila]